MDDKYLFKAKRIDWRELPKEKWWVKGYLFDDGITNSHRMFVGGLVIEPCKAIDYNEELVITGTDYYEIDKGTICRPTGLKDKHDNLIFENDIVVYYDCTEERYLIVWKQSGGCFEYQQCGYSVMNFDELRGCEVEVIGNSFDNPELLEGEETAIQVEKKYHRKRYGKTLAQGCLSGLAVVREEIIRNPAVYNLDALVKRLEKEKFIQQETVLSDVHQGYNAGLSRAIEILKKG